MKNNIYIYIIIIIIFYTSNLFANNIYNTTFYHINIKYHSYFIGEIADYYLNIYNDRDNIYFQFTLDIEIPNSIIKELLFLITYLL